MLASSGSWLVACNPAGGVAAEGTTATGGDSDDPGPATSTSGPSTTMATGGEVDTGVDAEGDAASSDDTGPTVPDVGELAACEQLGAPTCGDAQIGALEECDGGRGCEGCLRTHEPTVWVHEPEQHIDAVTVLPDGGLAVLWQSHGPIARFDASGSQAASWDVQEYPEDLVADGEGNLYAVGADGPGMYSLPWIESWNPKDKRRWSASGDWFGTYEHAAIDELRIVAAGETEQENSSRPRALVAQYDRAGSLQWSQKIASIVSVVDVAVVEDEVAVLGQAFGGPRSRSLLRLDAAGAVRWSVDVTLPSPYDHGAWGVTGDHEGGTWIFGQREQGPWARRHDRDGVVLDELDCLGGTTGILRAMLVEPDGVIVAAMSVWPGAVPIEHYAPWIARIEEGTVTWAASLGDGSSTRHPFALSRRSDGRLVVGLDEYVPSAGWVMEVAP